MRKARRPKVEVNHAKPPFELSLATAHSVGDGDRDRSHPCSGLLPSPRSGVLPSPLSLPPHFLFFLVFSFLSRLLIVSV